MRHRTAGEGSKVLIVAPFGRDAESLRRLLADQGYDANCFASIHALAAAIDDRAGVVLLTAEALRGELQPLHTSLATQPNWSDLPFVILAARRVGSSWAEEAARTALGDLVSNAVVLDRPIGSASLTSTCASALRARQKQFDMRDRLRELETDRALLEERVRERTSALTIEMENRAQAEAALRQSQKMDAIGQLTGGIAHDFNNMLAGVLGALEMIKRRIASGRFSELGRYMETANSSAQRAATLTARLLAFSRRQSLDSKPLDLNTLLLSLEDLLSRTIHGSIALQFAPGEGLPPAVVDANQLENAILNLVINARDAMPEGGQLTIETRLVVLDAAYTKAHPDVPSGRYVVITVSDTGMGMTPEVLAKAFDPFFTTKPVGQGTGLGLSLIYGFARQSGGQVRIHSEPGVGTSVSLYLVAGDAVACEEGKEAPVASAGQGQHILLVEDDPAVRLLVRELLEELSYTAIETSEADAAIPILDSEQPIDLMISDVGLPGMNGRQLAEVARRSRPNLPILFITGYAENAANRAGFLGTNMALITKPFAMDVLAAKVAEMLAAPL